MPPQRRLREYETAVEPDALHTEPEKLAGFGEKREVIKSAELQALRDQLSQALAQQGSKSDLLVQDGTLIIHDFQLTPVGLVMPQQTTFESWQQLGQLLFRLEGSIQWLIGDWINYGEDFKYGDIKKWAEEMGREPGTFWDYAYICRSIETSIRIEVLSFGHHRLVAPYTPEEQQYYLSYAAQGEEKPLSIARFRAWIKEQRGETPALPEKAEPHYNVTRLTESGHYVANQDLGKLPLREIKTAIDNLVRANQINEEALARMRQALEQRGKK